MSCCPPVRTAHSSCGQYWRLGYGRAELERQEITGEYSQGGDNSIVMPERGDVNAGEMWGCASIFREPRPLRYSSAASSRVEEMTNRPRRPSSRTTKRPSPRCTAHGRIRCPHSGQFRAVRTPPQIALPWSRFLVQAFVAISVSALLRKSKLSAVR